MGDVDLMQGLFTACAIRMGLVTADQMADALLAARREPAATLGDLLVGRGVLTPAQRDSVTARVRLLVSETAETLDATPTKREGTRAGGPEDAVAFDHLPGLAGPARYEFKGMQAAGGQAQILLAFDKQIGREIAIKQMFPESQGVVDLFDSPKSAEQTDDVVRFLREARLTGQLEHPNIVPVHEIGQRRDGALYYTMRFVRGRTLAQRLKECETLEERLKLLGVFWDVCNAVAFAHSRGVVHRDIKPSNVMVGEFGETVLLDWGIAKVRGQQDMRARDLEEGLNLLRQDTEQVTQVGQVVGTPSYMSPEQASGLVGQIDERSDVWGLGAMLYQILTGRPPFTAAETLDILQRVKEEPLQPVQAICPLAPAELAAVAEKALEKDPEERYRSSRELTDEIGAYMTGGRVRAHHYSSWELLRRFAARNKTGIAAAAIVLVVILVALVAVSISLRAETRARQREERERRLANFHLAQALAEKANRLLGEHAYGSAQVFAAASLRQNPAHPKSPVHEAGFAAVEPGSRGLWVDAASTIYRARLHPGLELERTLETGDVVQAVAFSRDGQRVASAANDGKVRVWDVDSGRLVFADRAHGLAAKNVVFTPDGRRVVSSGNDGKLCVFDAATGRRLHVLESHAGQVNGLSAAGSLVASAGTDDFLRLWDTVSGRALATWKSGQSGVGVSVLSPGGHWLASGGGDGSVNLWDVETQERLSILRGHVTRITGLAWSPDGRRLASGAGFGHLRIWNVRDGNSLLTWKAHHDAVYGLAFSSDGRWLATSSFDSRLRIWDPATGTKLLEVQESEGAILSLAFSPDGTRLVTGGAGPRVKVWTFRPGRLDAPLAGHADKITRLRFSPDGRSLATASFDKTARIHDLASGRLLHVLQGHGQRVLGLDWSPDGARLMTASLDGTSVIWNAASGGPTLRLAGATAGLLNAAFAPRGDLVASGGQDTRIRVWDTTSGELLRTLEGHRNTVENLAFSPEGKRLVSSGFDGTLRLWDTSTGAEIAKLKGHTSWTTGVDWSPDGRRIVSADNTGQVILWDADARSEIRRFPGHVLWVNAVRFSHDGALLATASDDKTVRVWSVGDGQPLLILDSSAIVSAVDFSPDGGTLAVGDGRKVFLYPMDFTVLATDPVELLRGAERKLGVRLDGARIQPAPSSPGAAR